MSLVVVGKRRRKRQPFGKWQYVEPEFRDLIVKMTNLDPTMRITARQALEHPWFKEDR
jgi:serine/threonine protein kinase